MTPAEEKVELEVELLRLQVLEAKRPFWGKKEFIGFQGSVLVSVLGVLISSVLAFWTNADKIADEGARKQVVETIGELASEDMHRRANAGNRLKELDSRFNFRELRRIVKQSIAEDKLAQEGGKPLGTPWLRVGAVEAVGSASGHWEHGTRELGNFLREALISDRSPLVQHQAALGLLELHRPEIPEDLILLYGREKEAKRARMIARPNSWMVRIPAGKYVIGRNDGYSGGISSREVLLEEYWIDEEVVSNEQWGQVMDGLSPYLEQSLPKGERKEQEKQIRLANPTAPVVGVSYADAVEYCNRTERELPTEAEWEVSGRGPRGWIFPWGMDAGVAEKRLALERAAKSAASDARKRRLAILQLTKPDSSDVSVFGVKGMVTGVREWTRSSPEDILSAQVPVQRNAVCSDRCVIKGASGWEADIYDTVGRMHLARRLVASVGRPGSFHSEFSLGFRCVLNASRGRESKSMR